MMAHHRHHKPFLFDFLIWSQTVSKALKNLLAKENIFAASTHRPFLFGFLAWFEKVCKKAEKPLAKRNFLPKPFLFDFKKCFTKSSKLLLT